MVEYVFPDQLVVPTLKNPQQFASIQISESANFRNRSEKIGSHNKYSKCESIMFCLLCEPIFSDRFRKLADSEI